MAQSINATQPAFHVQPADAAQVDLSVILEPSQGRTHDRAGAEMLTWSRHPIDAKPKLRLDMTLREAEDLVEGLSALVVAARRTMRERRAEQPGALAMAGIKVGADHPAIQPPYTAWPVGVLGVIEHRIAD